MRKILRGLNTLKANSFTLVELLVVISIIGMLAGMAVPAIQGGLDKAKQGVDVSNARQVGIIFFSEANDNNGTYRVNGDLTNTFLFPGFEIIVASWVFISLYRQKYFRCIGEISLPTQPQLLLVRVRP
jgi:prepilin-type N-terminal cleavage/methylation domain-containing protein